MEEKSISWRQAVQYGIRAKQVQWSPFKVEFELPPTTVVVPVDQHLAITEMRDWVFSTVGPQHALTALFNVPIRLIPDYISLSFEDFESAMLFKLTWY